MLDLALIAIFAISCYTIFSKINPKEEIIYQTTTEDERALFDKINDVRFEQLEWSNCLHELAIKKSTDLYTRNYFSHEDVDTKKFEMWSDIEKSCGSYRYVGENLVKDFMNINIAHCALMDSENHRKNIVNENFKEGAVGCYKGICTELFANLY